MVCWPPLPAVDRGQRPPPANSTTTAAWLTRVLEDVAIIVLLATVLGWLTAGSRTLDVRGTDAAHYHVPVAVNLALGANPLDLPATQHLYPMAASTLAAWFIVPVGDPLLVDLVTIVPFLLIAASLGWMFRLVTGESGLAWCTWLTLAVFSTPMFRHASFMSADLLFGATFAALTAQLLAVNLGARRSNADILLIGLATGLLIGAKTTGLLAAVLLLGLAGVAFLLLRRRDLGRLPVGLVWPWGAAGLLAMGTGGVWLARNWWLFGSPVAPNGLSLWGSKSSAARPSKRLTCRSWVTSRPTPTTLLWRRHPPTSLNSWAGGIS